MLETTSITMAAAFPTDLSEAELRTICTQQVGVLVTPDQLDRSGLNARQLAGQVARIVRHNLISERAQRVISQRALSSTDPFAPLTRYMADVIACYLAEHQRVERLAQEDEEEWLRLQDLMLSRAYRLLQHWQNSSLQPQNEAADFAQQTCETIFHVVFPYDVSFEAWATVILNNHIRQRYTRSRDIIDRNPQVESLDYSDGSGFDERASLHEVLRDPKADYLFDNVDVHLQIVGALERLPSQSQQDVIVYSYLDGWSDEQIAEYMGKTRQAIYNLRRRGLQQLRQIFNETSAQDLKPGLH